MSPERDRRRKQFWQLHVPLAVALLVCTTATVIEFSRATEGVTRAWAYTFQWPLFGLFAIWMWVRYRREDRGDRREDSGDTRMRRNPFSGLTEHWRQRVVQAEAAADAENDEQLAAWEAHVADQRRREQGRPAQRS